MKKEVKEKVRVIATLACLRSILNGRYDSAFSDVENDETIDITFRLSTVPNDILLFDNLEENRIKKVLDDVKELLNKYSPNWNKKWWK